MNQLFFTEASDQLNRILEASKAEAFRKWLKAPGSKTYKDYEAFVGAANAMAKPYWYKYMKAEGPSGAIRSRASTKSSVPKVILPTLPKPKVEPVSQVKAASQDLKPAPSSKKEITPASVEEIKKILYSVYKPPRDHYNPDIEPWDVELYNPNEGRSPTAENLPLRIEATAFTGDRGPRIDMGGGEDGNDWLEDYRVDELRDKATTKWKPTLDRLTQALEKAGYKVYSFVEYGEKGHVYLGFSIK